MSRYRRLELPVSQEELEVIDSFRPQITITNPKLGFKLARAIESTHNKLAGRTTLLSRVHYAIEDRKRGKGD